MHQQTFRKSMAWLHTWAGVVLGGLLFAVFWTGTLCVFDREIDRWMNPGTRLPALGQPGAGGELPVRLDGPVALTIATLTTGSTQYTLRLPSDRAPVVELAWRDADGLAQTRFLHPVTGDVLPHTDTLGGTGFIFPFHYSLNLSWKNVGYWLVGVSGMAMLVLVVSGVVIHRRIFKDFFLFRPKKQLQRASLDAHNLAGVLALPFHFLISLSGLVIFMGIYWPTAPWGAFGQEAAPRQAFHAEAYGLYKRPPSGTPATNPPMSLDTLRAVAEQRFGGSAADFIRVWHPGDLNAYAEVRQSFGDHVTMPLDNVYFDAATGAELSSKTTPLVMGVQRFISGMHFLQFRHWTLRWLYFAAGLAGCVLIATGFLFWLEARRSSHARKGLPGVRVVEALAVASVPGIIAATCAYFCANRLLPADAPAFGWPRHEMEVLVFYAVWLLTLGHAALRARSAWCEQAALVAVLALAAVVLNWTTTRHHPGRALAESLWSVASMDALLLVLAVCAARTAVHLHGRSTQKATSTKSGVKAGRA